MSSINWTDEQKKAIETRGGDLLVSAAAGSGKTAVLVERIIRLALDQTNPVDLDRLLVVTFTDAAAGEMRQRVGAALAGALQEQPGNPLLQRQLFLVPRAHTGTLHSFCSEVVRSHFYLLGLDPAFRVMDENEASMLRREVTENLLEEYYEEHRDAPGDAPFLYLTRALAGRHGDDRELVELVLRLYDFAHSLPRPAAWLNRVAETLERSAGLPWERQPWIGEWRELVRLEMENWLGDLEEALRLAAGPGGPRPYTGALEEDLERVRGWLELVDGPYQPLKAALAAGLKWPALPRVGRGEAMEEVKQRVQGLRNGVKGRVGALYDEYFTRDPEAMTGDLARVAPLVRVLVEMTLRFRDTYRALKLERAVADFTDLEHCALAILARNGEGSPWGEDPPEDPDACLLPSSVAEEYRDMFAEVLVDEYQDINGVQEAVLQLVSRPGRRFLVGDVKQSIYRFRLADPAVFLHYYRHFKDLDAGGPPEPGWRLDLRSNFRSRREVLEAVNYLFDRLMNERVAELAYDERARLNPGAGFAAVPGESGPPVEIHLLDYNDQPAGTGDGENGESGGQEENNGAEPEELDLVRLEARWVAEHIHRLVTGGACLVHDRGTGELRPATWRDVVVLMRSLKGRVGVFLEEFRRLGIPVYADGGGGYFGAPEVQVVVSLLQVIDNPARDIPLAAVLRSPLVGLDASRLAEIRLACPEGDFYTAVRRAAAGDAGDAGVDPQLSTRLRRFLEQLEEWRDLAGRLAPAELLEELYRQTGYCDLVGSLPGGAVRQANLRALVDRARKFEGTVYRGLFRFLRFVELLQEGDGDMDTARSLGENEDVVRLMTVHRSKGLEFPVVVVAGLGRGFNFTGLNDNLLLHRRLGCGPVLVDLERGIRYPTVPYRVIRQRLRLETLAEEMRLLYVALTRARERLVVTAAVRQLDRAVENWAGRGTAARPEGPLRAPLLAGAKCPVDWLGPALWSHPALAGFTWTGEPGAAGTENWRLFLWPAASLQRLRESGPAEEQLEREEWLPHLRRLEPLPPDWLRRREEDWPGGPGELLPPGEIRARLFWEYPHRELAGLPSKVTVTEWRHRQEELAERQGDEPPAPVLTGAAGGEGETPPGFELPVFYAGERQDGAERGRVVHLAMQNLVLDPPPGEDEVRRQLDLMVERRVLHPRQRQMVRAAEIARFLATGLGRRVQEAARAGRLLREVPFTLGLEVTELYPELAGKVPPGETVLLQGVIDCLITGPDGLVIIDYKTDRVKEERLAATVDRYRVQLDLYARAAESILNLPVREKYLYFFHLHRAAAL